MLIFNIIRWRNLLMIALVQILIKYHLMPLFFLESKLTNLHFSLVLLASLFIAAGGYIINDIKDIEADKINKPDKVWIPTFLNLKKATILYYASTGIGWVFGLSAVILMADLKLFIWFMLTTVGLFFYAIWLKKKLLVGNVLIALLVAFSLILIVLFEGDSVGNFKASSLTFLQVVVTLAFFAFCINLAREIVKDAEDILGDKAMHIKSIPGVYGREVTHRIIGLLLLLVTGLIMTSAAVLYKTQIALVIYLLTAVLSGLFLFLSQLKKVKNTSDYTKLSTLLKLLMFVGIFSVFFIQHPT